MKKKYLSRRTVKWSIAALVLIGLIGFTASHAFVNDNNKEENGEDRIIVKIIKIENGDTTIIEKHFDGLFEFRKLKHHLRGNGKSGIHFLVNHSNIDSNEDIDVKIKIIDFGSDSSSSIHKKIIICLNEDTLEHEDIHINLRNVHREIAKTMEELDIQINLDNNVMKSLHKIMKEFEMDMDIHTEDSKKQIEIIMHGLHDNKELEKLLKELHYNIDAI